MLKSLNVFNTCLLAFSVCATLKAESSRFAQVEDKLLASIATNMSGVQRDLLAIQVHQAAPKSLAAFPFQQIVVDSASGNSVFGQYGLGDEQALVYLSDSPSIELLSHSAADFTTYLGEEPAEFLGLGNGADLRFVFILR